MAGPLLQLLTDAPLVVAKDRPLVVVEFLDDLARPPPVQHIAAHQLTFQPVGDDLVPGGTQWRR